MSYDPNFEQFQDQARQCGFTESEEELHRVHSTYVHNHDDETTLIVGTLLLAAIGYGLYRWISSD